MQDNIRVLANQPASFVCVGIEWRCMSIVGSLSNFSWCLRDAWCHQSFAHRQPRDWCQSKRPSVTRGSWARISVTCWWWWQKTEEVEEEHIIIAINQITNLREFQSHIIGHLNRSTKADNLDWSRWYSNIGGWRAQGRYRKIFEEGIYPINIILNIHIYPPTCHQFWMLMEEMPKVNSYG